MNYEQVVESMLRDMISPDKGVDQEKFRDLLSALSEGMARTASVVEDHDTMHQVIDDCGKYIHERACKMHTKIHEVMVAHEVLKNYNPEKFDG